MDNQRHQIILNELDKKGNVTVASLVELTGASESSIRRDLVELDHQGFLNRGHGGATLIPKVTQTIEDPLGKRQLLNADEKKKIAKYAASLIEPNDFVYLDAGTTTELMIDYLTEKDITFVTNAVSHARKLSMAGYTTYILGGEFKATTEAIVGDEAIESLQKYNFTKGFWGTNGVHQKLGFSTPDVKEAKVKEVAMKHCAKRYVLCDSSKFSQISCVKFGEFAKTCIITTQILDESYRQCDNIIEVK